MTKLLIVTLCLILCTLSTTTSNLQKLTKQPTKFTFHTQIFVDQQNYYYYDVYTYEGKIKIQILDKNLQRQNLTFSTKNELVFRDAYYNFIIVEQFQGKTSVSYWVLEIAQCQGGHQLVSWAVNSKVDDEGFAIWDSYLLKEIVEYNSKDKLLYVRLETYANVTQFSKNYTGDSDIYAIDVKKKGNVLITVNWFYFSTTNRQKIVGGNSRVLVQATNNQIWIDTRNKRKNDTDPTIYEKINITSLTKLPIYKDGSLGFKLRDSYFVYVSLSTDSLHMTAFVWQGYTKRSVIGEGHIDSKSKPIKFFTDQWSFFLAVGDGNLYIAQMYIDQKTKKYAVWVTTLLETVKGDCNRKQYLDAFGNALDVIQHDNRLFVLTENKFYVFINVKLFEMTLTKKISQTESQEAMFKSINKYYFTLK